MQEQIRENEESHSVWERDEKTREMWGFEWEGCARRKSFKKTKQKKEKDDEDGGRAIVLSAAELSV